LLEGKGAERPPLERAIAGLAPADRERCLLELNYLTNVLVAGASNKGRPFRPAEAAETVMSVAGAGLARLLEKGGSAADAVARHGVVKLFRIGWRLR
jgi:hypothetical protein